MTSYNTIPASEIVSVQPNVLAAGGIGLNLTAVIVTESTRAPIGEVVSFARASDVAAYFGPASVQAAMSAVYFQGFSTSTVKPGSLGFWQYTPAAVAAARLAAFGWNSCGNGHLGAVSRFAGRGCEWAGGRGRGARRATSGA